MVKSAGEKCVVRGNITVNILALFLIGSPFFYIIKMNE